METATWADWVRGLWGGSLVAYRRGDDADYRRLLSLIPDDLQPACHALAREIARRCDGISRQRNLARADAEFGPRAEAGRPAVPATPR